MKKVYISGQITGLLPEEYLASFQRGEDAVLVKGNRQPVNPTKMWGRLQPLFNRLPYWLQLLLDLWRLRGCDEILMLPNYRQSSGAKVELSYAKALGLDVWFLSPTSVSFNYA